SRLFILTTVLSSRSRELVSLLVLSQTASYLLLAAQNIRVASIQHTNNRGVEKLTASSTQLGVISTVMVHTRLGKHRQILYLRLAKRRTVGCDQDKLSLSGTKRLECRFVAEGCLSGFHDELDTRVHGLDVLFLLLD
ncbi:hypothetical protein ACHAXN_000337, partial [Cyclotella atomus]